MLATLLITSIACDFPPEDFEIVYSDWCDTSRIEVVDSVYDGDTFDIDEDETETFRMLGIQAPELSRDPEVDPDCYGPEAEELLRELLLDQQVRLEFDVECLGYFGRTLVWVFIEDPSPAVISRINQIGGFADSVITDETESDNDSISVNEILINEVLIRAGYATLYKSDIDKSIRYTERLEVAEDEAEERASGLWGVCD
jgi:endonuclease YncB( thermonuclease family)